MMGGGGEWEKKPKVNLIFLSFKMSNEGRIIPLVEAYCKAAIIKT